MSTLDDLLGDAENDLKGLRASRARLADAVKAGLAAAEAEAEKIRGGTRLATAIMRIAAAFAAGLKRGALGL